MGTQCLGPGSARYHHMNSDDLTMPILDPAQLAELRRSTDPAPAAAPPNAAAWLLMMVLGLGIVVTMLVLVVAWS
ncbi:hypothetical protein [Pseudonocardia sp. TMWB2A]|uniref:hypothetical protein n=1 Tax=Pseudonocardia sp. TMWB2A TaxID=687430 RepID=UPI00307CDC18